MSSVLVLKLDTQVRSSDCLQCLKKIFTFDSKEKYLVFHVDVGDRNLDNVSWNLAFPTDISCPLKMMEPYAHARAPMQMSIAWDHCFIPLRKDSMTYVVWVEYLTRGASVDCGRMSLLFISMQMHMLLKWYLIRKHAICQWSIFPLLSR